MSGTGGARTKGGLFLFVFVWCVRDMDVPGGKDMGWGMEEMGDLEG